MRKKFFLIFLAVLISAVFLSCEKNNGSESLPVETRTSEREKTRETPVDGGKLRLCMYGVDTLNPLITKSEANSKILMLFYDSLFKLSNTLCPEYSLCENVRISENGLVYTLKIRNDVKFHSGSTLTADDVRFSILLAKEAQGVYSENLKEIQSVSSLENEVTITLFEPVFNFTAKLTFPVLKAESSVFQALNSAKNYRPDGTGVYKLETLRLNKKMRLASVSSHFSGRLPYIKECEIDIVKDKDAAISMLENDLIDLMPPQLISDGEYSAKNNLKKVSTKSGSFVFLGVNNQHLALLEPEMRNVLSLTIDREKIISSLNETYKKAVLPVYPVSWLYYETHGEDGGYNPVYAQELISVLGWADSDGDRMLDKMIVGEKTNLYLDILVNEENDERLRIAQMIKDELAENQIYTTITVVPYAEYIRRTQSGDYDLFVGEIRFGDNLDISEFTSGANNVFGAYSAELSAAFSEALAADGTEKIRTSYAAVCRELSNSMPAIGLFFKDDTMLLNQRIKGNISPLGSNIFANVCDWYIN